MEAELFGHERGAFTDAKESRMGLFEAADGGFLFLDEVGDVELSLQGKLLKAVEDRTVRRVGGIRDRRIDVRILAATNRDLERDAQRETFRRDLYFRLAVIILHLPPLRERGADILLLAQHYLERFNAKYGKDVRQIDTRAQALLAGYPWPGNVRELSHVIERAVLWSRGPTLDVDHLSLATPAAGPAVRLGGASAGASTPPSALTPAQVGAPGPLGESASQPTTASGEYPAFPPPGMPLDQWERTLIEQALRECDGNQTRAAQRLGISRDTLRYRLKKHGIQ
jgi:DNA-binding NtrC family response regulator